MCPAAPVTATLIGVFMAQLAINVSLSKAEANYMVMSSEVETSREVYRYASRRGSSTSLGMTDKISSKF